MTFCILSLNTNADSIDMEDESLNEQGGGIEANGENDIYGSTGDDFYHDNPIPGKETLYISNPTVSCENFSPSYHTAINE